jgi:hypothetical protein
VDSLAKNARLVGPAAFCANASTEPSTIQANIIPDKSSARFVCIAKLYTKRNNSAEPEKEI